MADASGQVRPLQLILGGASFLSSAASGGRHVWVAEADIDYGGDRSQAVIILELDSDGLIAREARYYPQPFEAPAGRAELVEVMG